MCCYSKREKPPKNTLSTQPTLPSMSIQPIQLEKKQQKEKAPSFLETDSYFNGEDDFYFSNHDFLSSPKSNNCDNNSQSALQIIPFTIEEKLEFENLSLQDSSGILQKKIQKLELNPQKKKRVLKVWDENEDALLKVLHEKHNGKWQEIAKHIPGRSVSQCSCRWRRLQPVKIYKRKQWTPQEDQKILELIKEHGKNWRFIASRKHQFNYSNLDFNGIRSKQVRERYINKIDPDINNQPWTEEDDNIILQYYQQYGCKWSLISQHLPGRPENMIKNRFYCYIRRVHLGIQNPYNKIYDELSGIDSSMFHSEEEDNGELQFY